MITDLQNNSNRNWLKLVAVVLTITFTATNVAASDAMLFQQIDSDQNTYKSTLRSDSNRFWDSVDLSRNIGEIKKTFHGTKDQIVIHIQDAHANYEAQRNIAKIVNYFVTRHNVHLVNVEGTSGEINTGLLSSFPDASVRRMVSDYFLREAKLTGAEYLALTKPKKISTKPTAASLLRRLSTQMMTRRRSRI